MARKDIALLLLFVSLALLTVYFARHSVVIESPERTQITEVNPQ